MNIIIPVAGRDKNFEDRGMIKPLTKVQGKEIIKLIAESRPFSYESAIFIVLREHQEKYRIIDELKRLFGEKIRVVIAEQMTEGSPQSILLAKSLIDNSEELLIDLGDQYLDLTGFDKMMYQEFMKKDEEKYDGIIPTFKGYYWNQGYMIMGENGFVKKISEKDNVPISNDSTACLSYFKKGSDFVRYAEQMIAKRKTAANGVYLPSLVYNEMIEDGKKIITCPCEMIVNLGKVEGADVFEQINRPLKWKQ
jgi:NDP-sugar pyrophosphorylase family protein